MRRGQWELGQLPVEWEPDLPLHSCVARSPVNTVLPHFCGVLRGPPGGPLVICFLSPVLLCPVKHDCGSFQFPDKAGMLLETDPSPGSICAPGANVPVLSQRRLLVPRAACAKPACWPRPSVI